MLAGRILLVFMFLTLLRFEASPLQIIQVTESLRSYSWQRSQASHTGNSRTDHTGNSRSDHTGGNGARPVIEITVVQSIQVTVVQIIRVTVVRSIRVAESYILYG